LEAVQHGRDAFPHSPGEAVDRLCSALDGPTSLLQGWSAGSGRQPPRLVAIRQKTSTGLDAARFAASSGRTVQNRCLWNEELMTIRWANAQCACIGERRVRLLPA